jgi:lactate dehydrogenase-like 2-hydroxyacid dehydrogenase
VHSTEPKPKVYYTHQVPVEGPTLLQGKFDVIINPSANPPTKNNILAVAHDAYGLCISVRDHIDATIINGMPNLKVISSFGRGLDNVDMEEAAKKGIIVRRNDGALMGEAVADLTWGLLLGLARKIYRGDQLVRAQRSSGWSPAPISGLNVSGKKLGVIGMGQLGKAVARRALGFDMQVCYYQPEPLTYEQEASLGLVFSPLETLLGQADFICVCSPLTKDTFHQIGERELSLMKPDGILINTGRGSLVDEEAVAKALEKNILGGYAADVFEMEEFHLKKQTAAIPAKLIEYQDRTLFTPHLGTAIPETRVLMAQIQAQAILEVLARCQK